MNIGRARVMLISRVTYAQESSGTIMSISFLHTASRHREHQQGPFAPGLISRVLSAQEPLHLLNISRISSAHQAIAVSIAVGPVAK